MKLYIQYIEKETLKKKQNKNEYVDPINEL